MCGFRHGIYMVEKTIFAGFGGQGVLLMGQLLAQAGMKEGRNTSWIPSYGAEMRGGTANCSVIVSDKGIASPIINEATSVVVMNKPSLEKFEKAVAPGGKLFINTSVIDIKAKRSDIEVYYVPCNEMAEALGNGKVSNMVMLGKYLKETSSAELESVLGAMAEKLGEKKSHLVPVNRDALNAGAGVQ